MAEDDDTLDESVDDVIHSAPPRPVVALYRALAQMQSCCDQVEHAIAIPDSAAVERVASRAVYWWLVANAISRRIAQHSSDRRQHVEPALRSVKSASQNLKKLFRGAAHQVRNPQTRRTLVQLRLCLAGVRAPSIDGANPHQGAEP